MKTIKLSLKIVILLIAVLSQAHIMAQIPSGYYSSANGLSGANLKAALHNIIDDHTEYPYSSSNTDVWDILKVADRDPNNSSNVIGLYSGFSMNAADEYANGSGWNREHVWAKSRGNFGTTMGAGTDLHHIRAEDVSTNSARNNRNFDECSTVYVDNGGTYNGTTPSYTSTTDWTWEPRAEIKGDVARMILYMTVRYEGDAGEPDLELTDALLSNTDQSPVHGKASVLIQWHLDDPVSADEISRNDIIYSYQNNRNPFIDHPEYVCMIYGEHCSGGGSTSGENNLIISEYVEGSSYNKGLEIANLGNTAVDLSAYSLKKQANGSGSWSSTYNLSGTLASGAVFTIVHNSASTSLKNGADVITSASIITFNGNDPIGLFKDDNLVDVVGNFNGGSSNFAANQTLVRKVNVSESNTSYTTSEWDVYNSDTFSYFGSHNGGGASSASDLFLSEYIEGSSYNKGLEIANKTGSSVNLSDYSLQKQANGSGSWGSTYNLSGTLASGDVFVIVNSSANSAMTAVADVQTGSGIVTFNGNDPIGLFKNGVLIDIIGTFNNGSSNFAKDVTLVRQTSVNNPNSTYTGSEWNTYANNTFSYLGDAAAARLKNPDLSTEEEENYFTSVFPNPATSFIQVLSKDFIILNIEVLDVSGRVVYSQAGNDLKMKISTHEFDSGIYFLRIMKENNQLETKRIIIQ